MSCLDVVPVRILLAAGGPGKDVIDYGIATVLNGQTAYSAYVVLPLEKNGQASPELSLATNFYVPALVICRHPVNGWLKYSQPSVTFWQTPTATEVALMNRAAFSSSQLHNSSLLDRLGAEKGRRVRGIMRLFLHSLR